VFDQATYADENVPERLLNAVVFTSPTDGWIAGEFATLLRTTDGGETWVGQRSINGAPADLYLFNLSAAPGGPAAAVGLAGSVLVSSDAGAVWESRSVDTTAELFAIAWNGEHGARGGDRGVIFVSTDGGRSGPTATEALQLARGASRSRARTRRSCRRARRHPALQDGGCVLNAAVTPTTAVEALAHRSGRCTRSDARRRLPAPGVP
jgi:photosystem II stability/assembly factor-like uncharacterized protein